MLHKSQNIQYVTFNTKYVLHFSNLLIHILFNEINFHAFIRMLFQSLILQIMDRNCKMIRRFGCFSTLEIVLQQYLYFSFEHSLKVNTTRALWLLEVQKVFWGWRQPVRFTDFVAETLFWELSFFIRNYKKRAVFEKFSNQYFVFFWKHFIVVSCLST